MREELTKQQIDTALRLLSPLRKGVTFDALVDELGCKPAPLCEALVQHRLADLRSREAEAIDRSLWADTVHRHEAGRRIGQVVSCESDGLIYLGTVDMRPSEGGTVTLTITVNVGPAAALAEEGGGGDA